MSMTKRNLFRFVVAFMGVAMMVAGGAALLRGPDAGVQIFLAPEVEVMGVAPADDAPAEMIADQPLPTETPQVKLASAVVSESSAAIAMQEATATPASDAAQTVPTVDVTAAVLAYQNAYPVPQRIMIDKLKVNAKIQPVGPGKSVGTNAVEWTAPSNKNVGWHDYSGRIGEGKNVVLNGHNNIYGAVFRKLYTLQAGDEVKLLAGDKQVTYRVEEVMILKERGEPIETRIKNAQYIQPMADDRLTIISCWPENNNTHRVVVIARPVSETAITAPQPTQPAKQETPVPTPEG
jgi:sortase A